MSTCGGHTTSLAYWATRCGNGGGLCRASLADMGKLKAGAKDSKLMRKTMAELGAIPSEMGLLSPDAKAPVRNNMHLLVATDKDRRHSRGTSCHTLPGVTATHALETPALPDDAFCEVGDGLFVSSPELTFLQMASIAKRFDQVVETGYLLCGAFALSPYGYDRVDHRDPVTSVEKISAFLAQMPGVQGVDRARQALQYVHGNCDSPPEVHLSMDFGLPEKRGGRGWPLHDCAHVVPLEEPRHRRMLGCDYIKGDVHFPSLNSMFEYDSYEDHMGKWQFDHTQKRAQILRNLEYTVVSVTYGMVMNNQEFDDWVYEWERYLGIEKPVPSLKVQGLQHDLHAFLTQPQRRRF